MEIHYCTDCRTRVSSVDLEQGRGVLKNGSAYCETCARKVGLLGEEKKTNTSGKKKSGVRKTASGVRRKASRTGSRRSSSSSVRKASQRSSHSSGMSPSQRRKKHTSHKQNDVYSTLITLLSLTVIALLIIIALILTGKIDISEESTEPVNVPAPVQEEEEENRPADEKESEGGTPQETPPASASP